MEMIENRLVNHKDNMPESSLVVRLGRAALPAKLQSTLRHFFGSLLCALGQGLREVGACISNFLSKAIQSPYTGGLLNGLEKME